MTDFDIIVVGGGHAGIEAASAAARMGCRVALITMNLNKIGLMSCNPAIGGLAKGQLVKEIDALGGEMGKIIDESGIHFKMLNKSKGPAVWSPRAQADRQLYAVVAKNRLENISNLALIRGSVNGIIVNSKKVSGVTLEDSGPIYSKSVILTTGTFLNGLIHIGLKSIKSGRAGDKTATGITESLVDQGFKAGRLKTGTPPRLDKNTIDFAVLEEQLPDNPPTPFSFSTESIENKPIPCYIGHTNNKTHEILQEGFQQSPMFTGRIKSIGPRYCPSIEDKINRFSDRERHQLFLEPEGYENREIYLNGFSTSLPEEIQVRAIKTIPGLAKAEIVRLGYAVEYDFFPPYQLFYSLETKKIIGLFFAGQINGTSGYEEAAAQGLISGINAAAKINKLKGFRLKRSEAYIGVLIDDLINKSTLEPYRMFTSRAEFRLFLRQDNADIRLFEHAKKYGLLLKEDIRRVNEKKQAVNSLNKHVKVNKISARKFNEIYDEISSKIEQPQRLDAIIKRPEVNLAELLKVTQNDDYPLDAIKEVEYNIKYEGYLKRNLELINKFKENENRIISKHINYKAINALSLEARDKLNQIQPESLGQASRISGVSPADISVLMIYLEREKYNSNVPRET
ncbi:MAG: tRNA uridine-5-carboxymethylaminomethyl(34) synthesis enzyme MnmG [Calditrichia bacterium]|nr:tRNA uridine-5-carboxymethylaminomethyl(34) synthesis enzyme MnmG [Calditrichia bacterium]